MILCWGHSFYCSKWRTKFHNVKTGHRTFAESVVKHIPNSKLTPRGRKCDSMGGPISVTPPCNRRQSKLAGHVELWNYLAELKSVAEINCFVSKVWRLHDLYTVRSRLEPKDCRFCGSGIGMSCNVAWSMFITARNQIGVRCALGCWLSIPSLLQLSRHSVGVCMHKLSTHGPCDQDLSQKTYVQLTRKGYLVTSFPLRGETENVNSYASKPRGRMFFVPQCWFQLYGISHPCEKCLL